VPDEERTREPAEEKTAGVHASVIAQRAASQTR
jgi:hypothetical protein